MQNCFWEKWSQSPLAAFLYLGSGIGLLGIKAFQNSSHRHGDSEARIKRTDLVWLAGALIAGGVAAPITLLFSLQSTPAATASLLLNFEAVATTVIAALALREAISRRAWSAIALITLSSILLSINFNAGWRESDYSQMSYAEKRQKDKNFSRYVKSVKKDLERD